jgi:hypothetical protein
MREIDSSSFKDVAFLNQTGNSPSSLRPIPGIAPERLAIQRFHSRNNQFLQIHEVGFDGVFSNHHGLRIFPEAKSIRVEGRLRRPIFPGQIRTALPKILSHCSAVVEGGLPLLFALVDTSAVPACLHNSEASGCAVMRTAIVLRSPVNHAGQVLAAGNTQVTGPGHKPLCHAASIELLVA